MVVLAAIENGQERFVRRMPAAKTTATHELIGRLDYSDTWTANSPTRAGSYLLLDTPESLRMEHCHGNPPRHLVFSSVMALTTWPSDNSPVPWPGFQVPGSRSGFTEAARGAPIAISVSSTACATISSSIRCRANKRSNQYFHRREPGHENRRRQVAIGVFPRSRRTAS